MHPNVSYHLAQARIAGLGGAAPQQELRGNHDG